MPGFHTECLWDVSQACIKACFNGNLSQGFQSGKLGDIVYQESYRANYCLESQLLPEETFQGKTLVSFIKNWSICFQRCHIFPQTQPTAATTTTATNLSDFFFRGLNDGKNYYSSLKPLKIHRSCLCFWSFLSLWVFGVLSNFGVGRLFVIVFCPDCVLCLWDWTVCLIFHEWSK